MNEKCLRLLFRFMLVMLRGLVTLANANLSPGQVKEILDLKRELRPAAYPAGVPPEYDR